MIYSKPKNIILAPVRKVIPPGRKVSKINNHEKQLTLKKCRILSTDRPVTTYTVSSRSFVRLMIIKPDFVIVDK